MKKLNLRALVLLFLGAIGLGLAPIFVKLANPEPNTIGPAALAFFRMLLALPALIIWTIIISKSKKIRVNLKIHPKNDIWKAALAGIFFSFDMFFWNKGLSITNVANATLFVNTAPFYVVLFSMIFLKEKPKQIFWLGLFSGFIGIVILMGNDLEFTNINGDLFSLLAGFFYASYLISIAQSRKQINAELSVLVVVIFACITLFIITISIETISYRYPMQTWLAILGMSLLVQTVSVVSVTWALGKLPLPFASVGLLLQPIISTIIAAIILDEFLSLWQIFGGFIVLLGIYFAQRSYR
jgi:drug/metabolite transporter (DMT)-like permease